MNMEIQRFIKNLIVQKSPAKELIAACTTFVTAILAAVTTKIKWLAVTLAVMIIITAVYRTMFDPQYIL